MKFGFIGAGKVGFSLGKYFAENGLDIAGYYSEWKKDALEASAFTGSSTYEDMEQLVKDSDILFLTVPDGVIASVWEQMKSYCLSEKIVCHCSGALSSEVFTDISEHACFGFSIHPLFAVSDKYHSYKELSHSYFTLEGSPEKMDSIQGLFARLGNPVRIIAKKNKVKYHAAAAVASNLVVGVLHMAERLMQECGFDKESAGKALSPIIRGNVETVLSKGCVDALTGPVERNDETTVQKHLSVLSGNGLEIYRAVSEELVDIAKQKYPDRDYGKMEAMLR